MKADVGCKYFDIMLSEDWRSVTDSEKKWKDLQVFRERRLVAELSNYRSIAHYLKSSSDEQSKDVQELLKVSRYEGELTSAAAATSDAKRERQEAFDQQQRHAAAYASDKEASTFREHELETELAALKLENERLNDSMILHVNQKNQLIQRNRDLVTMTRDLQDNKHTPVHNSEVRRLRSIRKHHTYLNIVRWYGSTPTQRLSKEETERLWKESCETFINPPASGEMISQWTKLQREIDGLCLDYCDAMLRVETLKRQHNTIVHERISLNGSIPMHKGNERLLRMDKFPKDMKKPICKPHLKVRSRATIVRVVYQPLDELSVRLIWPQTTIVMSMGICNSTKLL